MQEGNLEQAQKNFVTVVSNQRVLNDGRILEIA